MNELTDTGWKSLNSKHRYITNDGKTQSYITPEFRALKMPYVDPLTLNFKLMIDYSKHSGLFADEKYTNSALAYLKRIGEENRYEMLKRWIDHWKSFIKNYDFLILGCEGLEVITNNNPSHSFFTEESKLSFTIRDTAEMRIQSLLAIYRMIWFDDTRCVEVLPDNLRRFDLSVLVYAGGYYNMMLYDASTKDDSIVTSTPRNVYPTIRKLSDDFFTDNAKSYEFNHFMVYASDACIHNEESGKSFFTSLSNEPGGEIIKTGITFEYRFAGYNGIFNGMFEGINFMDILATSAALDKLSNQVKANKLKPLPGSAGPSSNPEMTGFKAIFQDAKAQIVARPGVYGNAIFSDSGYLGNAIKTITSKSRLTEIGKQAFTSALTKLEDKFIYSNLAKIHNLVSTNFSTDFYGIYGRYFNEQKTASNVSFLASEWPISGQKQQNDPIVDQNGANVYKSYTNRGGF